VLLRRQRWCTRRCHHRAAPRRPSLTVAVTVTHRHSPSLSPSLSVTLRHSLSLTVAVTVTHCHSPSLSPSLTVTHRRCHRHSPSLSVTHRRCHRRRRCGESETRPLERWVGSHACVASSRTTRTSSAGRTRWRRRSRRAWTSLSTSMVDSDSSFASCCPLGWSLRGRHDAWVRGV
jgi:hypothetical protein